MKFEAELNTVNDIASAITKLITEGEKIADKTGETFWAGNEQYIPVTSPEFEEYSWVREEHYLPDNEGFWYSSSMQNC